MRVSLALTFVIAVTTAALGQSEKAAQTPDYVAEPEALQIYATLVADFWSGRPESPILLQQKTDDTQLNACGDSFVSRDPEWVEVRKSFVQQNARRKLLPPSLPIVQPYRLLTPADIELLIGPLKKKYQNYN